jgi:DNA-directed RNA polymerase subunit L
MELGVAQFAISYPDYFDGKFNPNKIEVRVKNKSVKLSEVKWDKENHIIQIYLEEPISAGNKVELVFNDVKNPAFGGIYYFNCQILTPGDIPLPRYLGTWELSIAPN